MSTGRKRRKVSPVQVADRSVHEVFTQWSIERGVKINKVKAAALPGRGVGIETTAKLRENEQILFVPARTMFRPDKILLQDQNVLPSASPHAQLALSIMASLMQQDSPLKPWAATWPTQKSIRATMPIFWPSSMRELLPASTNQPLERQAADFSQDCTAVNAYVESRGWKLNNFEYYWAIVNSRSFHFKPGGIKPGYMVLCPFIDYMNHGPSGSGVHVSQTAAGYEVKADRDYDPGEEILATYGAHSNDKLLVHYGFICSSGEGNGRSAPMDDDIRLDHLILPKMDQITKNQLQDVGYLGAYALLPVDLELCFKTQAAIRAMLLTSNEWEYFIANGEDLTSDQSERVNEWLRPVLEDYLSQVLKRVGEVGGRKTQMKPSAETYPAISLLDERWYQILCAVMGYQKKYRIRSQDD